VIAGACLAAAAGMLAACGGSAKPATTTTLPPDYIPLPAGQGVRYHLPAISAAVAARRTISGLSCRRRPARPAYAIHLELYANHRVLPVPAGIGIAPPQRRQGAYVRAGACVYAVRTHEPTGVVVVGRGRAPTLGTLFAVWGQPLSGHRLAGFGGAVRAFLGGRPWPGPPARIPLTRHAEIVLEVGRPLPPHRSYLFPPGL
jgi:hypothetical protein